MSGWECEFCTAEAQRVCDDKVCQALIKDHGERA